MARDVLKVPLKRAERLFLFFRRLQRRQLPLGPGRIRPAREIDPIPELPVHELARMIIDADDAARQIWEGYENEERLIIPKCKEILIMDLLNDMI